MKKYFAIIVVVLAMLLCLATVSFAAGYDKFFSGDSSAKIPAGWSKGEKKGWDGQTLPPGIAKKDTATVNDDGSIASPDDNGNIAGPGDGSIVSPELPPVEPWSDEDMENAEPYPMPEPTGSPEPVNPEGQTIAAIEYGTLSSGADRRVLNTIATGILEMVVGTRPVDLRYDVNGDGKVDAVDALFVKQYAQGLNVPQAVAEKIKGILAEK